MVTSTIPPSSGHRPTRSQTHPRHAPRSDRKPRVKAGEPFDPEELCRRLEEQERQQKERSRRRATERQLANEYHHVPKVAAQDFERTATPDMFRKKSVHKLARTVLDRYRDGPDTNRPGLADTQSSNALEGRRVESFPAADRNQFQMTKDLEDATRIDKERNLGREPQKDSNCASLNPSSSRPRHILRPLSTGDLEEERFESLHISFGGKSPFDRQDWTQRDESLQKVESPTFKERVSPFLKKRESVWSMRHRKSGDGETKDGRVNADEVEATAEENARKKGFHWPLLCMRR